MKLELDKQSIYITEENLNKIKSLTEHISIKSGPVSPDFIINRAIELFFNSEFTNNNVDYNKELVRKTFFNKNLTLYDARICYCCWENPVNPKEIMDITNISYPNLIRTRKRLSEKGIVYLIKVEGENHTEILTNTEHEIFK